MLIPVQVRERDYFSTCLEILNPVLKLAPRERDVLSAHLVIHYRHRDKDPEVVGKAVNSSSMRRQVREILHLSEHQYNNILMKLRNKKIFTDANGDVLSPVLRKCFPEGRLGKITFTIEVLPEEKKES